MFELFSKFCDDEPDQIWENLMQYIYDNRKEVELCSRQCLLTGVRLRNTASKGELAIHAKCDICLILVGKGNTGFGEVIHVTPTKTPSKCKRQQKTVDVSVQQAVTQESHGKNNGGVTPNHCPKCKRVTASISKLNILPESGKTHNTCDSNGTRTRHTSRQLRHTYKDINYKDMDVKSEDDESPPRKCEPSIAACLRAPSFPWRRSQGIITQNRLQQMASPNTRAKLIRTAIKIETAVKKEDEVKKEPIVNTRRSDRSWPKSARLVHLDRTPCYEECIANDHYGKYPDFPDDNTTEPRVTPQSRTLQQMQLKQQTVLIPVKTLVIMLPYQTRCQTRM